VNDGQGNYAFLAEHQNVWSSNLYGRTISKGFPEITSTETLTVLQVCYSCLVFLAFRWRALAAAFDAFVAISLRWSSVIVSSRAFPPFLPREGSLAKVAKCASKRAAIRRGSMRRCGTGPFHDFYAALLAKGMKPEMARLTLARKIAAITLTLWKKEERFDAEQLKTQAA
jgi:hypothetical protein